MLCGIPLSEQDHFGCPGSGVGLGTFSILKGFFLDIDFEFFFSIFWRIHSNLYIHTCINPF